MRAKGRGGGYQRGRTDAGAFVHYLPSLVSAADDRDEKNVASFLVPAASAGFNGFFRGMVTVQVINGPFNV